MKDSQIQLDIKFSKKYLIFHINFKKIEFGKNSANLSFCSIFLNITKNVPPLYLFGFSLKSLLNSMSLSSYLDIFF